MPSFLVAFTFCELIYDALSNVFDLDSVMVAVWSDTKERMPAGIVPIGINMLEQRLVEYQLSAMVLSTPYS